MEMHKKRYKQIPLTKTKTKMSVKMETRWKRRSPKQ